MFQHFISIQRKLNVTIMQYLKERCTKNWLKDQKKKIELSISLYFPKKRQMCSFRMIEQRLRNHRKYRLFYSAKKMFTTDHSHHSRMHFAVPLKRSCARIETKKGTFDFTEMQNEEMVVTYRTFTKLANILRRVGLPA